MSEEEPINKYELADWVHKNVRKQINHEYAQERRLLEDFKNQINNQLVLLRGECQSIHAWRKCLANYEKEINKKRMALQDRNNNLQNIYNKMIEIEQLLQEVKSSE